MLPTQWPECIHGAKKESPLFISGLSMGGFGALRIGAKYAPKFRAISGHSSITSLPQIKFFAGGNPLKHIMPRIMLSTRMYLKRFYITEKTSPPIRFDCGTSDLLINYNRSLHKKMEREGILHAYQENPGGHEWSYWSRHIIESLKFFAANLYIKIVCHF